ncbi:MAG: YeiH family protein [Jatrophihabitans sp.]|uniref:YeiH family protein n=1 Tax=Jatrophihabitans sp. TaxID=1932789 RepID=UPI003F7CD937
MTTTHDQVPARPARATPSRARALGQSLPALAALVLTTVAATAAGARWPVVGAPVVAVVLGVVAGRPVRRWTTRTPRVLRVTQERGLQLAVVLLGVHLSLRELGHIGVGSLPVMLGTLAVCLIVARVVGGRLRVPRDLRVLIGAGTGICGASAIAAVSSTIRARHDDVAYAISTIFVFNIVAVLTFPPVGHLLGMSGQRFGVFAGTAVNDTSSVIAAAQSFGGDAESHAVVVKLVRTLMIVPICLWLGSRAPAGAPRPGGRVRERVRATTGLIPTFLVAFVGVVALNSAGGIPTAVARVLGDLSPVLVTAALAAIGLSVDVRALRRAGARPLVLGLVLWIVVSLTSLGLQASPL